MGIINELWIIHQAGMLLYNQNTEESLNATLLSGLLSTIVSFAENLQGSAEMHVLKFGKSNFVILKSSEYETIFAGRAGNEASETKIKKILQKIEKKFIEKFGDQLLQYDGDVEKFLCFEECIDLNTDEDNIVNKFNKLKW